MSELTLPGDIPGPLRRGSPVIYQPRPRYLQHGGTPRAHFDLTATKRAAAVRAGAEEVTARGLVDLINRKRAHAIILAAPVDVLEQVLTELRAVKP